jgi:uncharacterized repeat protein (TIGR01451 family)
VTFTVALTNNGPGAATNVAVSDTLAPGLQFLSAAPPAGTTFANGVWAVPTIAAGQTLNLTITAQTVAVGTHANFAVITHSDTGDPNDTNNQAAAEVDVAPAPSADLAVTKTVNNPAPTVGDVVTFTVGLTNNGPAAATSVVVGDELPDGLAFVSATASQGTYDPAAGLWAVGTVPANATQTLQITARVTEPEPQKNLAFVDHSDQIDPDLSNDTASVLLTPTIPPPPTPTPTPTPAPTGPAIFAVGSGGGTGRSPVVNVYDAATGAFKYQFQPFEAGYTGGVRVAVAHGGDGQDYLAVAAGPGGFLVRTFLAGPSGVTPLGQIVPFGTLSNGVYTGFTGGIFVALGDLKGDGGLEVVCGADGAPNGDPFFNVWDLSGTQQLSPNVYAFEKGFHGGVRVAVGDVDGDGTNEIIAAAGPNGLPYVQVVNGQTFALGRRFEVFVTGFTGGVTVATGILDASRMARIVVGADGGDGSPNDAPVLRTFNGTGGLLVGDVPAFEPTYHGGVNVATSLDGRGRAWVLASPARAHNPQVDVFSAGFTLLPQSFTVIDATTKLADANFANGVAVGG